MGSRPARCIIRLVARPSGPISKLICPSVTLTKKILLAFGKQFKRRPGDGLPADRGDLGEEAVAVAGDFENAVRRHLIAPGVVIEERGINRNLGVLLWRIEIGKRHLRVQEMNTDVIDPARSRSIGQYNHPDTRFRIVSDE